MATKLLEPIDRMLTKHRSAVHDVWINELLTIWSQHYQNDLEESDLRMHANRLLSELTTLFGEHSGDGSPRVGSGSAVATTVREMSVHRTKTGFKPTDTAKFVLILKRVMMNHLVQDSGQTPTQLAACLTALNDVLDHLSLLILDSYVDTREKIITQQSASLLELSTPIIRLWDQILMLPLVGVIDTLRARQFTERLLEAIAHYEATVTIIDITGVPVVDTSVARHIMKTVDAAQLLGSRIIMTGISPASALTLIKLGISFEGMITRATLRAGVAEALHLIGRRIVSHTGAR
ncbi:STAS domain-containing protein [Candidatus Symbiobacter mobilis]|nr:STAS domain-containing protein [Candidatus Symbiobacter mobilis]